MNRIDANEFAASWIEAWNKKDVGAVLKHYVEDAIFISPKGRDFVGTSVMRGKGALSEYWQLAAQRIDKIEFKLDRIVWDSISSELVIFYQANLNGVHTRACETMKFDSSGRQVSGEAMYGAPCPCRKFHPVGVRRRISLQDNFWDYRRSVPTARGLGSRDPRVAATDHRAAMRQAQSGAISGRRQDGSGLGLPVASEDPRGARHRSA